MKTALLILTALIILFWSINGGRTIAYLQDLEYKRAEQVKAQEDSQAHKQQIFDSVMHRLAWQEHKRGNYDVIK